MKKAILLDLLSVISGQIALAAGCPDTNDSKAAKTLRLSGKVLIQDKDGDGQEAGSGETDKAKRVSSTSAEYKFLKDAVKSRNGEILSPAYGLVDEGSIMVVIRKRPNSDGDNLKSSIIKANEII